MSDIFGLILVAFMGFAVGAGFSLAYRNSREAQSVQVSETPDEDPRKQS